MDNEGNLKRIYDDLCLRLGWTPRDGVRRVLDRLDDVLDKDEGRIVFMEYPTGYGKSAVTLTLAKVAVDGNPFFSRVIHVLPMRTIADDLGGRLQEWLGSLGVDSRVVGIQHLGSPGSPFFAKKCVVVTLDTFLLNFYKAPAYELVKLFKYDVSHYEFPRGNIYSSVVVFDEFHLLSPPSAGKPSSFKEEAKALCAATKAIINLAVAGVPVVVMTATMPKNLKDFLRSEVKDLMIEEVYSSSDPFEKTRRTKMLRLRVSNEPVDVVAKYCRQGSRVLVVLNTVEVAVEVYSALKNEGFDPLLLHGRLPESVKGERIGRIKDAKVLVATQVVEAGIDESFDVLVSEVCPPDRLLQRMGRVARKEGHDEGEVVVVGSLQKGVYDQEVLDETWNLICEMSMNDFRSKSEVENGVREIMDKVYGNRKIEVYDRSFIYLLDTLESDPRLDVRDAKNAIKAFGGFTESFGIVSAFAEDDVRNQTYTRNVIGLSEAMARKALERWGKVVKNGSVWELTEYEKSQLLKARILSLEFLERGYEGVVLEEVDLEVGFVGVRS